MCIEVGNPDGALCVIGRRGSVRNQWAPNSLAMASNRNASAATRMIKGSNASSRSFNSSMVLVVLTILDFRYNERGLIRTGKPFSSDGLILITTAHHLYILVRRGLDHEMVILRSQKTQKTLRHKDMSRQMRTRIHLTNV